MAQNCMRNRDGSPRRVANTVDFANPEQSAVASLTRIERLILDGKIEPLAKVCHSLESETLPPWIASYASDFFPTAANPLHWAQLHGGLIAMARFFMPVPWYSGISAPLRSLVQWK